MGICNKIAGAIAPLILIHAITKNPDEIDQLEKLLPTLQQSQQHTILDELSVRLIAPYAMIAVLLVILCLIIRLSQLPDIEEEESSPEKPMNTASNIFKYPYLILGAVTIFCGVSVEVLTVDSIINYGQFMQYSFKSAKYFATYTFVFMMISYVFGAIAIPKYISQKKVLQLSGVTGLILSLCAILIAGKASVWCIALLGLSNALLWPSIWPLAIEGLGKFTRQGSAIMIMGIIGGAVTPLLYGHLSDLINPQRAYWVLIPCYLFILFFAVRGHRIGKSEKG